MEKRTVTYKIPLTHYEALRTAAYEEKTTQTALIIKLIADRYLKGDKNA